MEKELFYQLALGKIPGIGPVYTRRLLHHFGEASAIFRATPAALEEVVGLGSKRKHDIVHFKAFAQVEKELVFLEKYSIRPLFITDKAYPQRLLRCPDAPILLFFKGKADLNAQKTIAIIGTRSPSEYGRQVTEHLVRELARIPGLLVVSGLAYGIDVLAHRAAIKNGLPTLAILGHGLDQIYPREHTQLAKEMLKDGGLLTRFGRATDPDTYNFPLRNRIVAGISDAILVTETRTRGGSLLTIENALTYHRKIFAIPGRVNDERSSGCNTLIRDGKAQLLTSASQLIEEMHWEQTSATSMPRQGSIFQSSPERDLLSENEKTLLELFDKNKTLTLTDIHTQSGQDAETIPITLLTLELLGHISTLPGKMYRRCE